MAFTPYHNITGSTGVTVELLSHGDDASNVKSIALTNTHATADATVSLSIVKLSDYVNKNAQEVYKLISTVAIPSDTTLLLDDTDMLSFDNSSSAYSLFITVGASDTLDVLIKS